MKITKRFLTAEEANIISSEIKGSDGIIGYLPAELTRFENVFIVEQSRELAGVLIYIELPQIIDLKIFIIREKFREHGYGHALFQVALKEVKSLNKPVYTVTRSPIVIHLLQTHGFQRMHLWQLPARAVLHQTKMVFSWYRIREYMRKEWRKTDKPRFSYWIFNP